MGLASSIQSFDKKFQNQYLEPSWGWGLRVALSVTVPLIWGAVYGKGSGAEWMAIAGECVSFIELKGNIGQRVRLLLSASILSVLFCIVGSIAGNIIWIGLPGIFIVGFLSGLFKNLGDRGMGLALSVYIFYIIASAYPVADGAELWARCGWVALGSLWTVIVGLCSFLFIRIGTPYRRTIAAIWRSVAALAQTTGKGLDGRHTRSSVREIYLKEKDVRTAIDNSLSLFEETLDQVNKKHKDKYALAQSRRIASLVSLHIIQISELTEQLTKHTSNRQFTLQFYSLFRTIEQIGERMDIFLLTLKEEERILVSSRIDRLKKLSLFIAEQPEAKMPVLSILVKKILVLTDRVIKLVDKSLDVLSKPDEQRVYRSYSFIQTLNILHPRYLTSNIKQLFNPDRVTTKYALRIGVAAFIGALIGFLLAENSFFSLWLQQHYGFTLIELHHHGYWIPFTTIIVSQPYFGATLKKGIERTIGTLAGIIVGTGFLMLPFPDLSRFILVFASSVFLIYFLRRQYSVAAFFITLMLVGLLAIEPTFNEGLMYARLFCTIIGSVLAISAGFLLLPAWDKNELPKFLAEAFISNFAYFRESFYNLEYQTQWTKLKRTAETKNSNAYDSFTRFMQEMRGRRKGYANYYYMLTHNVRITRELNNFHSETELEQEKVPIQEKTKYYQMLNECDDLFRENLRLIIKAGNKYVNTELTKTFPENGFANITPTENQLVFVEKVLIELKAVRAGLSSH
ncbi:FUSC family protein [Taibaiella lutea]|uniref:FUSC family protein n=1 Tax=Taibaiella lutea TaxID=2608001 RepID=A0A5M6CH22_9BACT|nr:FUSC family protein [Taibaiella lutea]KAA5532419.1 FUSC family protein [Taibaiella lutea]